MCGADIFLLCLSVLFPPIGVWVKRGICSADSLINIALCCLGYLPGLIHAGYIILSYPDEYEQIRDQEAGPNSGSGGVVTYYYVQHGGPGGGSAGQQQNYGTVGAQPSAGQFPGQQTGTVNAFAQQQPKAQSQPQYKPQGKISKPQPEQQAQQQQQSQAGSSAAPAPAAGSSSNEGPAPPSYADVIKGDHKVQSQD